MSKTAVSSSPLLADFAVVGGGVVGLVMTLGLLQQGWRVALIAPPALQVVPDQLSGNWSLPVYALSPASLTLLNTLNIDPGWLQRCHSVQHMHISAGLATDAVARRKRLSDYGQISLSAPESTRVSFSVSKSAENVFSPAMHPQGLAAIVEEAQLIKALWSSLTQPKMNTKLQHYVAPFQSFTRQTEGLLIALQNGQQLKTSLLLGCDGAQSAVRQAAGFGLQTHAYGDRAIVANFTTTQTTNHLAAQWFQSQEILALLPIGEKAVSMVWSCAGERATERQQLSPAALQAAVEARCACQFGALTLTSEVSSWPLSWTSVEPLAEDRLLLAGDAAHRIHPLAGQGLNLGLEDVAAWLDIVAQKERYRPLTDNRLLARYQRRRTASILAMRTLTDALHGVFVTAPPGVQTLSRIGMNFIDRVPVLKQLLVQYATR